MPMLNRWTFALLHPLWRLVDLLVPKRADHWAFATHHLHTGRLIENQRAMFEHVKDDPNICKVIFYRGAAPEFTLEGGTRYHIVRHGTLRGLYLLARCKVVFLTHSIAMDYSLRWGGRRFSIFKLALRRRLVINLWHGIPLKRLLYAANEAVQRHTDRVAYRVAERRHYAGLIASSDVDSYAMASMFYPLNYRQMWITGLPRNDFLTEDEASLPAYIRDSLATLRGIRRGRRLVVYAPTYRQTDVASDARYYQFSEAEIAALRDTLRRHNAVLGYRPHYFRNSEQYFNFDHFLDEEVLFDLSQGRIPEFSAIARECDLLITDYSSVFIETLYLGKPTICFGYDIEHYRRTQDGLLYDMSLVFPGPVIGDFADVVAAIPEALAGDTPSEALRVSQQIFFRYRDNRNCQRVCEEIARRLASTRE